MDYHQSVAEQHPNLVLKFVHLKDLEDVYTFNIILVGGGKLFEEGERGVYITALIRLKNPFMVNSQPLAMSFFQLEVAACKKIFSWPFLKIIDSPIMTKNNSLVSRLLGYQFKMKILVPKQSR